MMEPWTITYCIISYNILLTHFKGHAWDKFSNIVKFKVQVGQNEEFSMMKKSVTYLYRWGLIANGDILLLATQAESCTSL